MNRLFANLTLSTKVLLATGGTLVLVVAIACSLVIADHYQDANARLLAEAVTQAELLGTAYNAPALAVHDHVETDRLLSSLQAAPAVLAARVYDERGVPFADYQTVRALRSSSSWVRSPAAQIDSIATM